MIYREPAAADFPFAGWVPTVNGHLSFRHIGEARHPTKSVYANIATEKRRLILGVQRRPLSDVLFQWIIHYFGSIEGSFWFVIAADAPGSPGDIDEVLGSVFVYKSTEDWKKHRAEVLRPIDHLNANRLSLDAQRDATSEETFELAKEHLGRSADIRIDFILNRSGEVFFARPLFQDSNLEYASTD